MTEKIVFYHNPRSRASMVHVMLEEVGADYETRVLDLQKREHKTPEFLAINPMGKLPTIVDRGVAVTETPAIIAHLADLYPQAGLAPALGDPQRGAYYRWLVFGASCFEPAMLDVMLKREPVDKGTAGYGSFEDVLATLKSALTPGPYLLGERFSAADVYIGSELNWAMMFGAPGIKGEPVFDDYVARVTQRPAFQRAQAQSMAAEGAA
ncbi:MAG TPA: glutathione S-transferase family protein [Phenylobacterium sp.]